jgi:hypothetical protein
MERQGDRFADELYASLSAELDADMEGAAAAAAADEAVAVEEVVEEEAASRASAFGRFRPGSAAYDALSVACKMVVAWLARMLYATRLPSERVLLLSMADLLAHPATSLRRVSRHLGMALEQSDAKAIARGPAFKHYAKDTTIAWNSTIQKQLLQGRAAVHADDIADGVAFAFELIAGDGRLRSLSQWVRE